MMKYLAYCGLYCGACSSIMAYEKSKGDLNVSLETDDDSPCTGCRSAEQCDCEFAVCNIAHESESCGFCPEFPCAKIIEFNNTEWPHHYVVLENLARMKEIGLDAWLEEQKKLWSCKTCGARTHWYQSKCSVCGETWEPRFKLNP